MYQDFDKRLDAGINDLAPDLVDDILSQNVSKIESESELFSELNTEQEPQRKKVNRRARWLRYGSCVAAVLCLCLGFGIHGAYAVQGQIIVDVNPSIELSVNSYGKVIDVKAVNDDGEAIVKDVKTKQGKVTAVLPEVFNSLQDHGYLEDERSGMLVSYCYDKKESVVEDTMDSAVKSFSKKDKSCTVICQKFKNSKTTREQAKKAGVSVGKYHFVNKIKEENVADDTVTYDQTMEEIVTTVDKDKIATSGVDVYEAGASSKTESNASAESKDTAKSNTDTNTKTDSDTKTETKTDSDTSSGSKSTTTADSTKSKTETDSSQTGSTSTAAETPVTIASIKCSVTGKVRIIFSCKVKYSKTYAVIIKDSAGNLVGSTLIRKTRKQIAVQTSNLVKGEEYQVIVRDVKAIGSKKFTRVTGSFTATVNDSSRTSTKPVAASSDGSDTTQTTE